MTAARHRKASLTPEAYGALWDSAHEASAREKRHVSLSERLLSALAAEAKAQLMAEDEGLHNPTGETT